MRTGSRILQFVISSILPVSLTLTLQGCGYSETGSSDLKRYEKEHGKDDNQYQLGMIFGDFGGLSTETLKTNAYPLKLAVASLLMDANKHEGLPISFKTYQSLMQRYGFYMPEKIENLKEGVAQPNFEYPMGVVRGSLDLNDVVPTRIELANITCSACHGGVTYDKSGKPKLSAWLGVPNTSLNITGYVSKLYQTLKDTRGHENELLDVVRKVYPNLNSIEMATLELGGVSQLESEISKFASEGDNITGYADVPPGGANAVAAFKKIFGIIGHYAMDSSEVGYVNIPDMAYRGFKSNITTDGTYTVPGEIPFKARSLQEVQDLGFAHFENIGTIAALFPISVQGVQPWRTESLVPQVQKVVGNFFANYKPPVFPGAIDISKATQGEKLFQNNCQSCHGQYEPYSAEKKQLAMTWYPNRLVPLAKIGTDPMRITKLTDDLRKDLQATWIGARIPSQKTNGYMAPILSGLWATAPYLHNGSVPTLWQMMNPELRPKKFFVGGHRLDFKEVGLMPPSADYKPWATPVLFDTSAPGQSNAGHENQFTGLTPDEKWSLIEYLKLL